jgi:hypothetical protein
VMISLIGFAPPKDFVGSADLIAEPETTDQLSCCSSQPYMGWAQGRPAGGQLPNAGRSAGEQERRKTSTDLCSIRGNLGSPLRNSPPVSEYATFVLRLRVTAFACPAGGFHRAVTAHVLSAVAFR